MTVGDFPWFWDPWRSPEVPQIPPQQPVWSVYEAVPVGCICPAGANLECARPDCPRKAPSASPSPPGAV